jgi:hypothetical protein
MVYRTWRTPDRRWLVDEILDEPGVVCRIWDAEGLPAGEFANHADSDTWLREHGADPDQLVQMPVEDPWCE